MIFKLLLAVASSSLLVLSFPNFNLWPLAWVGFVPLFFAIHDERPVKAFLISYIAGILFFLGTIYWLIHVTLPGMIAVALYLAVYFGLFGMILAFGFRLSGYKSIFFAPALWVTLELIRSHLFGGFGWVLLAHSQSYNLPMIQIADITGAYGVSFLIVMVNMAIYLGIKNFKNKELAVRLVSIAVFMVFLSLSYGIYRLNNIFTGEKIRVAVVQGNIPQTKKWDAGFREEIMSKYEGLTRAVAAERVDLIVWPETSVPGYLDTERDLVDRIKSLAAGVHTPILIGAPREDPALQDVYYNSAILFAEDGRVIDSYDKLHLVPFGEYLPLRQIFSFVQNFAPSPIGDFTAGKNFTVFKFFIERNARDNNTNWRLLKKAKFSTLICFEDIFPELTRKFVRAGALFMVNMTNDAWFGDTSAAYQHAQNSVFRAVENRVNFVRAANTGLSCFIDQKGRIVDAVEQNKRNLFVDGFKAHELVLTGTRTFYNAYGDVFAILCVLLAIILPVSMRKSRFFGRPHGLS